MGAAHLALSRVALEGEGSISPLAGRAHGGHGVLVNKWLLILGVQLAAPVLLPRGDGCWGGG